MRASQVGERAPAERRAGGLRRAIAVLGVAGWVVPASFAAATALDAGTGLVPDAFALAGAGGLFAVLVTRLLLVAVAVPERRVATLALAAGLLLWTGGSVQVSLSGPGPVAFPSPGEWLFLSSSALVAVYLFVDPGGRARATLAESLEAAVACGGAVCLTALLVVTPVASGIGRPGVNLLVALVYPVIDLVLLLVVVAQVVLRTRALSPGTAVTVLGLGLLTVADTAGSTVNLGAGTYGYGLLQDLAWCLAYQLVTDGACRPRREPPAPGAPFPVSGLVTVAAAAVALVLLALQPSGAGRPFVVVPAAATLVAAGARLVLALRQARGAAEAYRLSQTDELTGLPNRRAVIREITARLGAERPLAVMILDLDGFKEINDSLGHRSGDGLLQIVARRLRQALPADVMAARLGSDEFALVLGEADPEALVALADAMRVLIRKPIHLDGLEIAVELSAGIAVRDGEVATKGDLLRCADVAMFQAKRSGAGTLVYDPLHDEFSRDRLALAEELRHGLEKGQLAVWYQPQVEVATGQVCSVEALVRWRHPTQGLLAPGAFLPAARRAGLMPRLTEVVLADAVRDLSGWLARGLDVRLAVNIAPPELLGGTVLPELRTILARERVPADRLIVEVTEDSFLAEPEHARRVIEELRAQGVQVSVDDYGTGFSSLAYLRDLPLQELKIDRSFVANILTDRRSWMIVSTTTQLAHGLGLRTVAEGVEEAEQRTELRALGVDVLQGYHLARPMPADHLVQWLEQWQGAEMPAVSG